MFIERDAQRTASPVSSAALARAAWRASLSVGSAASDAEASEAVDMAGTVIATPLPVNANGRSS
jgi:hypothetical protein